MIKRILGVCLVLFALAPCSTKASVFSALQQDYPGTLNKSRALPAASSCLYAAEQHQVCSYTKRVDKKEKQGAARRFVRVSVKPASGAAYGISSPGPASGPPRYILFKRLKVDMV